MPRPETRRIHLSTRAFLAITAVLAGSVSGALGLWAYQSYEDALAQAGNELESIAQINAAALGLQLRNARRAAEEVDSAEPSDEALRRMAHAARLSGTDLLEVLDGQGKVLATTAPITAAHAGSLSAQLASTHRTQMTVLGWAYQRDDRHWLPLMHRADLDRWVVISIPIEAVLANWARPRWPGMHPIGLRSGDDRILLRFPFEARYLGTDASAAASARAIRDAADRGAAHGVVHSIATETDSVDRMIGWALVPGSTARALVATDVSSVRADWFQREGGKWLALGLLTLTALISWVWWRFRVVSVQTRLAQAAVTTTQALDASADSTWLMRPDGQVELGLVAPWIRQLLIDTAAPANTLEPLFGLAKPAQAARVREVLRQARASGAAVNELIEVTDAQGQKRSLHLRGDALGQAERGAPLMAGTLRDVSNMVTTSRELEATSRRLQRTCELAQFGTWHVDLSDMGITLSPTAKEIYGLPPDYPKIPWFDFAAADGKDFARLNAKRKQLIETGEGYSEVVGFQRASDRKQRWIRSVASPIFEDGKLVAVEGSLQDVTSLIEIQGQLQAHEQTNRVLSTALEASANGVLITDERGRISWANPSFLAKTGWQTLEVLDQQIERLLPAVAIDGAVAYPSLGDLTAALHGTPPPRIRIQSRDEETYWFDVQVQRIAAPQSDLNALVWVFNDVTQDVRREAELEESTRRFELATRNAEIGVWEVDFERQSSHWSDAMFPMFGLPAEGPPLSVRQVADRIHPEDRERVVSRWTMALKEGSFWEDEFRIGNGKGRWRWLKSSSALQRGASGRVQRVIGTTTDATAGHEIERERASRVAAEARTEAKNTFLSRMSHELRTPLNAIIGYTQLMRQRPDNEPAPDEWLGRVESAGWHLLSLIDEVLDLSRIESGTIPIHCGALELDRVLRETLCLVEPMAAKAQVRVSYEPTAAWCMADDKRLKQIVLNLFTNAVKYNRPGGQIWLSAAPAGGALTISVRDNGLGMDDDQLARLFIPFERLGREESGIEGTGIGLTICKTLAERMNGDLSARSRVGQGSTFELRVPLAEPQAAPMQEAQVRRSASDSVRRVLCVEDNLVNALLLEEALHSAYPSWDVRRAMTVAQAKDRLKAEAFDFVLLDLNLPDGNGVTILDDPAVRARLDSDSVILLTADATDNASLLSAQYGLRGVLTKPFRLRELADILD